MVRVSAVFVAACMVLICASFGAVLYLTFGLPATEALVSAIAALTGMAVCTITASSWRRRGASPAQIVELSRGVAELARQVVELGRRVAAMEGKNADTVERAEAATLPLTAEIGEIGVLIAQLAQSVSAHELALQHRAASPEGVATAAPVAPVSAPMSTPMSAPQPMPQVPPVPVVATASPPQAPSYLVAQKPIAPRRDEAVATHAAAGSIDISAAGFRVQNAAPGFKGLTFEASVAVIREAIEANRIEFFLQPVFTLPQRKVRFYEALARLRTPDGELLSASDFIDVAEAGGLMPRIDTLMLFRCVQVARRLMSKNRDVGLFCNLSASTLVDAEFFPQVTDFIQANRAVAPALVLELTQAAYRTMGPLENESLTALMGWGFRFSMDHVGDLKFEPRDLADRGFRFIKVPATLLLNRHGTSAADIHAADLTGLLTRFGIDLIAEKIESEGTVVDLLDYEVRFGQGDLFSPPRPVRADLLQAVAADAPPAPPEPAPAAAPPPAKATDPRLAALQRPTAIAQIARAVVARAGQ